MPSSTRTGVLAVAIALVAALGVACSSSPAAPAGCESSAQCATTAHCVSNACVENRAPTASIALPSGPLEETVLLTFDGSASGDPDPGDAIASYAWNVRAISAACAPPAVAGTGPSASVRFGCTGRFAVDLGVVDTLGASGTATQELDVVAYSGPPLLTLGPDVVVGHQCAGGLCAPSGGVALSASPTAAAPQGLAMTWTVEPPPGRPLDAHRRVTFTPGPEAASPIVAIETDGQAISGDWIFRVEARDDVGLVASGAIRVSVGNSPPVVTKTIDVASHTYDGSQLLSAGAVPFTVADPDGDDLLPPVVDWRHVGDGPGGAFSGTVLEGPPRVTFAIAVPYSAPSDAAYLIGGTELARTIRFSVTDVNEATASEDWPITVGNSPPTLASTPVPSVDHTFDAAASAYVATAPVATWVDPDGDPLFAVPGTTTGDPVCPTLELAGAVATVRCSLPFTGTPGMTGLLGVHGVTLEVTDPWAAAAPANGVFFIVLNRPPSIVSAPFTLRTACSTGACCFTFRDPETGAVECAKWTHTLDPGSTEVTGRWVDDDGDPLDVALEGAASSVCTPTACSLPVSYGGGSVCVAVSVPPQSFVRSTSASDGASSASGTITVEATCGG